MKLSFIIYGRPIRWKRPEQRTFKGRSHRYVDPAQEAAKKAMRDEAAKQWGDRPPWTGPIALRGLFVFYIPKTWPPKLRGQALDGKVWHIADPDYDQLIKLAMDALRGLVYVDDNQIAGFLPGSAKRYGDPERSEIDVLLLDQPEGAVTPGQHRIEREAADRAYQLEQGLLGRGTNASKTSPARSGKKSGGGRA